MSSTAQGILIAYTALSIVFIIIGLVVFRSTRVGFRVKAATRETVEKREGYWGIAVIVFLVAVLGGTMAQLPYSKRDQGNDAPQKLAVAGRQFAWTVKPARIRTGKTQVVSTSLDVSHGVGIYDPDDVLIAQVNVLPDVRQNLGVTFKKTGTYRIRCLEFCGVDHHLMETTFEVTR
jgi:cytochrome c oxidase subunit II